uniref:C3H1-type domain-containing protein n=1 Tax=Timema genevievae TaxID=629358 RepID=A0A7R9PK46_TIMGE|nr:unnamed protein product [Timema genevievae]
MLPSTGYFKSINCPFFDSGLCERPYCHFRHVRKDASDISLAAEPTASLTVNNNDNILQLVSEAVKKVLQSSSDVLPTVTNVSSLNLPTSLLSKVVEELNPSTSQPASKVYSQNSGIPFYKPTPIAELKKRHIPVPYSPSVQESKVEAKRRTVNDELDIPARKRKKKIEYSPRVKETKIRLTYNPNNPSVEDATFFNGAVSPPISYTPSPMSSLSLSSNDYVPSSIIREDEASTLDYKPSDKVTANCEPGYVPSGADSTTVTYQPSDKCNVGEPEYSPVGLKPFTQTQYVPSAKSAQADAMGNGEDWNSQFDILDEILQAEEEDDSQDGVLPKVSSKLTDEEAVQDTTVIQVDIKSKSGDNKHSNVTKSKSISEKKSSKSGSKEISESKNKHSKSSKDYKVTKITTDKRSNKHREDRNKETKRDDKKNLHHKDSENKDSKSKHSSKSSRHSKDEKSKENDKYKSNHSSRSRKEHSSKKEGSVSRPTKNKSKSSRSTSSSRSKHSTSSRHTSRSSNNSSSKDKQRHDKGKHTSGKSKTRNKSHEANSKTTPSSDDIQDHSVTGSHYDGSETDDNVSNTDDNVSNAEIIISDSEESESNEEAITDECYRIFQEYEPKNVTSHGSRKKKKNEDEEVVDDGGIPLKRRVAHAGAETSARPINNRRVTEPKKPVVNPTRVLVERFIKAKENASLETNESEECDKNPSNPERRLSSTNPVNPRQESGVTSTIPMGRVRIAHVANVSLLLNAKDRVQNLWKNRLTNQMAENKTRLAPDAVPSTSTNTYTTAQSVPKGSKRQAHTPSVEVLIKPSITEGVVKPSIPLLTRQKHLEALFMEYSKHMSTREAYDKSIADEIGVFERSSLRTLYTNRMVALIQHIRHEVRTLIGDDNGEASSSAKNRTISHASVLAGKPGTKGSWSVEKTKKQPHSTEIKYMYESLEKYILTDEDLVSNGFPRPHPTEKGIVTVQPMRKPPAQCPDPFRRICNRCNTVYQVNKHGLATVEEQCIYHPGRAIKMKLKGALESRYWCCKTESGSVGCCTAGCHVTEYYDPNDLRGFVTTFSKEPPPSDGDYGVYALDCEMVYTSMGLELARVTVIDSELRCVYETLVKPENIVLDCNTRFSGITHEDLENVSTTIFDVQAALLGLFSDKTILVGHSLDSDFKALKIVHNTVVDTSVMFPHRMGPPFKRSLKNLAQEILMKVIQEDVGGHDSSEDAVAAMELVRWKVLEDRRST